MTTYLNFKGPCGRETVDVFTSGEDAPAKASEFRAYVRAMAKEYAAAGIQVYMSSRACRGWNAR